MNSETLLEVRDLHVRLPLRGPGGKREVRAVDGVSFSIRRGETLGLVGESGSGKTTIARAIMQLTAATSGEIDLDGNDWLGLSGARLQSARRRIQMVFQDPYSSLDPSRVIDDAIAEPLLVHTSMKRAQRSSRVRELLEMVGLSGDHLGRYPYEFSGGQRQRIAIARALAAEPDLIVLDEAVSALDVSTQNQVLELLERLQTELGVSYLFISHDLSVVSHIADRVLVLYLGRTAEQGAASDIFDDPQHPYTKALLSAVPVPDPVLQRSRNRLVLEGELPDATDPPSGCVLHPRCPHAIELCRSTAPKPQRISHDHVVACHMPWAKVDQPISTAVDIAPVVSEDGHAAPKRPQEPNRMILRSTP